MINGTEPAFLAGRIPPIYLEGRLPLVSAQDVAALGLRQDQVVQPTLTASDGQPRLLLDGRQVILPAQYRLPGGEVPQMRVLILPNGSAMLQPMLQAPAAIAATATAAAAAAPATAAFIGTTIERLLSRPAQASALQGLLTPESLHQLVSAHPGAAELGGLVRGILMRRPRLQSINGQSLREAVQRSGVLSEAKLAEKAQPAAMADEKIGLRKLLSMLESVDGEAAHRAREALQDLTALQLGALAAQQGRESGFQAWVAFADHPPVRLQVTREGGQQGAGDGPEVWRVDLHSDSPELGGLWLQTRLLGRVRAELTAWIERPAVYALAQAQGERLVESLRGAGIEVSRLQLIPGVRPEDTVPAAAASGSMIDVRA